MPDRAALEERLRVAELHVALGKEHINRQRELVASLKQDSHDVIAAKRLLKNYYNLQAMHVADVKRLVAQLASLPK
jgi:hypothetical protein